MASGTTPFHAEVQTPAGAAFSDEVVQVSTRTGTGEIGILARHQPVLALLDPCELRLHKEGGDVVRYAQGDGYLQVSPGGGVLILVDEAVPVDELDSGTLDKELERYEKQLSEAEEGSEAEKTARRGKHRVEAHRALLTKGD